MGGVTRQSACLSESQQGWPLSEKQLEALLRHASQKRPVTERPPLVSPGCDTDADTMPSLTRSPSRWDTLTPDLTAAEAAGGAPAPHSAAHRFKARMQQEAQRMDLEGGPSQGGHPPGVDASLSHQVATAAAAPHGLGGTLLTMGSASTAASVRLSSAGGAAPAHVSGGPRVADFGGVATCARAHLQHELPYEGYDAGEDDDDEEEALAGVP